MKKDNISLDKTKINFKKLFTISKKIKKTSNKKFIIFDMLYCLHKYKTSFDNYLDFEFYTLNNELKQTYLTEGKNKKIINLFNDESYKYIFNNQNEFNNYFKDFLNKEYLSPKSNKEEFYKFIANKEKITINNKIIETKNLNYEEYKKNLLEENIIQNKKIAELYNDTLNTIHIITFYDNNKVHILQTILKINDIYTFIDNGTVTTPAVDKDNNFFGIHPISKKQILGFKIPLFKECIDLVTKTSKLIPQVKYIEWIVALKEDKPVLLKAEYCPNIYQIKPRFIKDKKGILSKYEKIMNIEL